MKPNQKKRGRKRKKYPVDADKFTEELLKCKKVFEQSVLDMTDDEFETEISRLLDNNIVSTRCKARKIIIDRLKVNAISPYLLKGMIVIVDITIPSFVYNKSNEDRDDCHAVAVNDMMLYWTSFSLKKGNNAFNYLRTTAFTGLAKGWRKLHPKKNDGVTVVSLDSSSTNDDTDGIYSI